MPGSPAFRVSVDEHAAAVRELLAPLVERPVETVALDAALGRVAAEALRARFDLPRFRNSQMDGFAVRAADVASASADHPVALPVVAEIPAAPGTAARLEPGTAARIMTGAPVPQGADAVIPVEDTAGISAASTAVGPVGAVAVLAPRAVGEFVREPGSELRAGAGLAPAGRRLTSRDLGALAAAGVAEVPVRIRVRAAVVSTGSELAAVGDDPAPGAVVDANGPALAAALAELDVEVVHRARVADEPDRLAAELDAARAAGAELVVTSGGISMGEYEVVRELLEPRGARVGSVAMQPGGPQALGAWEGVPVLAFPGNPVSSQLSLRLFLAPLLREIAGLPTAAAARAPLAAPVERSPRGRRQYLRGVREPDGAVRVLGGPGSHLVATYAAAELLVVVPEEVVALPTGADVEVWEL
ncbi:MAG: molybdopterin molybdotransferase MoeA [Actinomycetales bacterium]|nr:molybdopterin molybdotransferase MoeA [Actinomycetales bacterium]